MVKHMYIADFEIKCTGERVDITWANPQRKNGHHSKKRPCSEVCVFMLFMSPNNETQYVTTPRWFWLAPRLCYYIFSFRISDGCGPECFTTSSDG